MNIPRSRSAVRLVVVSSFILASALGAFVAWTRPVSGPSVMAGWAALYGIPAALVIGRGVPAKRAAIVSGKIILAGLPLACLYGLVSFAFSGTVGLVGGFGLVMLSVGWLALLAAAFPSVSAVLFSMFDVGSSADRPGKA